MHLFKIGVGQYCLALLNSPQEDACKHLFEGLLVYLGLISMDRSIENPIGLLLYGLVYQDLYLPHFEDIYHQSGLRRIMSP